MQRGWCAFTEKLSRRVPSDGRKRGVNSKGRIFIRLQKFKMFDSRLADQAIGKDRRARSGASGLARPHLDPLPREREKLMPGYLIGFSEPACNGAAAALRAGCNGLAGVCRGLPVSEGTGVPTAGIIWTLASSTSALSTFDVARGGRMDCVCAHARP